MAMRRGRRRLLDKSGPDEAAEHRKGSVRAKVEHPLLYVKRYFGYSKVRCLGLAKNSQRDRDVARIRESAHHRSVFARVMSEPESVRDPQRVVARRSKPLGTAGSGKLL